MGRRGGDHADGRPRRRRDRCDDRRRLPGRHPRRSSTPIVAGDREEAVAAYERWLPLINYENRQCGLLAAKALMKEGGVIALRGAAPSRCRRCIPATRAGLIETARRLDPLVLRWGR